MAPKDFSIKLNGVEFNSNSLPDSIKLDTFDDATKRILSVFDTDSKKGELSKAELKKALTFFAKKEQEVGTPNRKIEGDEYELMARDPMLPKNILSSQLKDAVDKLFGAIKTGRKEQDYNEMKTYLDGIVISEDNKKEQFEGILKNIKDRDTLDLVIKKFGIGIADYDEKQQKERERALKDGKNIFMAPVVKIDGKLYDIDLQNGTMSEHKIDVSQLEQNPDGTYIRVMNSGQKEEKWPDSGWVTPGEAIAISNSANKNTVYRLQVVDKNGYIQEEPTKAANSLGLEIKENQLGTYYYKPGDGHYISSKVYFWNDKTKSFITNYDLHMVIYDKTSETFIQAGPYYNQRYQSIKDYLDNAPGSVADCEAIMKAEVEVQQANKRKLSEQKAKQFEQNLHKYDQSSVNNIKIPYKK